MFNRKIQKITINLKKTLKTLNLNFKEFKPYQLASHVMNGLTSNKGYRIQTNLAYGLKARQRLDLYVANGAYSKGLIVFVHGGAWSSGDKSAYKFIGEAFTRYNYDVAVINYHLAPENIFPSFVDDLDEALKLLEQKQEKLGISTENVALLGHSAGAFNIASLIYHPNKMQSKFKHKIKCMIGVAGPYHFDYKDDPLSKHAFDQMVPFEKVMPYYFVEKNEIKHYLFVAENDQIVKRSNSDDLCTQLRAHGNHCEVIHIPATGHITIMGSVASLFSRYFKTRKEILRVLDQSFSQG